MALRKGISIDKVSKLMAPSAIKETQVYAKIMNEELDKAINVFNVQSKKLFTYNLSIKEGL